MATLIAAGTAAADSSDFTLTSGANTTLSLVTGNAGDDVPNNAVAYIQLKSAGGNYFTIGQLDYQNKCLVMTATGTFRVRKPMSAASFGVERD